MAPVARRVAQARRQAPSSRNPRATVCMSQGYDSVQARREAESLRVDSRTKQIHSLAELDAAFTLAGDKLIMLAIESEEECVMSDDVWDRNNVAGTENNKEQCRQLSASLARIAREADNVVFLRVEVLESGETRQIAKELNITKFPTYQYWKVRARSHGPIKRPNRAPHQFTQPTTSVAATRATRFRRELTEPTRTSLLPPTAE